MAGELGEERRLKSEAEEQRGVYITCMTLQLNALNLLSKQ